uniref:Uncharacterized protein n=1 Tax=Candidatus Kentrum eta TaxID=2126337 RepID=A0A450VD67_9GAMM|nr:MAG: hypothetical protein BECKH772A_GA0070896_101019 [Candidatus Kentron sp. H]VFJ97038.1 MAG: hypothetical protein BECKH772B_GA0070898_101036 [Candidatus Kentron sp. H]VFK02772.1 MAG: hypothetical protein BECKH772C_GA0070978_101026 [Candidatus Kentron sp. H]
MDKRGTRAQRLNAQPEKIGRMRPDGLIHPQPDTTGTKKVHENSLGHFVQSSGDIEITRPQITRTPSVRVICAQALEKPRAIGVNLSRWRSDNLTNAGGYFPTHFSKLD